MLRPLTRKEVRDVDRRAIDEFGMSGLQLMENAARGAAELLLKQNRSGSILIVTGKGNNAGDGFVMARHLENYGCDVKLLLLANSDELAGDALFNYKIIEKCGIPILQSDESNLQELLMSELSNAQWIVDAMLGTGITGDVREPYQSAIKLINASRKKIFAVDLPSGLDCDTGEPLGICIKADITATFVAMKTGFNHPIAKSHLGKVQVIDIGVPQALIRSYL